MELVTAMLPKRLHTRLLEERKTAVTVARGSRPGQRAFQRGSHESTGLGHADGREDLQEADVDR